MVESVNNRVMRNISLPILPDAQPDRREFYSMPSRERATTLSAGRVSFEKNVGIAVGIDGLDRIK